MVQREKKALVRDARVRRKPPSGSAADRFGFSALSEKTITLSDADGSIKALNNRLDPGLAS
jgi:hypothetical protein